MSSWLGKGIREEAAAIGEAYAKMQKGGYINPGVKAKPSSDPDSNLNKGKDHPKGEAQKLNNSYEDDSYESQLHETSKKKMFQALIQRAKTDAEDGEKAKTASGKDKAKETARRIREKNVKEKYQKEETVAEGKSPCEQALETDKKMGEIQKKVENDVKRMKEGKKFKEEIEIYAALQDAYAIMSEGKKKKSGKDKCGEGTYWDSEEKKCKSKSKSSGGGSRIYFGGGYGHGHSGGGGTDNGGDTDGGDGGDGGGDGGGGGGE